MLLNVSIKDNSAQRASVIFKQSGEVVTNLWGQNTWWQVTDPTTIAACNDTRRSSGGTAASPLWSDLLTKDPAVLAKPVQPVGFRPSGRPRFGAGQLDSTAAASPAQVLAEETPPQINKEDLVDRWFRFFSEFKFKPQPRFINTLVRMTKLAPMQEYVVGYFELTNNSYAADVAEKVKSREFKDLCADTAMVTTGIKVNTRFEVYYGEPGGGKTTTAICNNPDAKVVLCHASMTPDELFRGFDFEEEKDADGNVTGSHPVFKGCALREAMEQGKVVILDEINLLNEDCRRALQAVTDNKAEVTINNDTIKIAEGFKVVGTMNLNVGDMVFPLPPALVDRAETIKRFEMDAKMVAKLAI